MTFRERIGQARRDDSGMALGAVVILMAVTAIIATTLAATSYQALARTNGTIASVEARGAADAGIAEAELVLRTDGECQARGGVVSSTTPPVFEATISHTTGGEFQLGCPTASSTQVRVLSIGDAARGPVGNHTRGQQAAVEVTFNYVPDYVEVPVVDPAVYAYRVDGVLKKFVLESVDTLVAADVQIRTGDFECSNGASVSGSVILGDGSARLDRCTVGGSLHAASTVHALNSSVRGDVISSAGTSSTAVNLGGTSEVRGSVYAGGSVAITNRARVLGNVTAAGDNVSVTVDRFSRVDGNILSAGTISGTAAGTETSPVADLETPPAAQVGEWTDLGYDQAAFASSSWAAAGFTEVRWSGSCTISAGHSFYRSLSNRPGPIVVNALSCGAAGLSATSNIDSLTMGSTVAFVAQRFDIGKLYATSSDPTQRRNLMMIVPDQVADKLPTCAGDAGGITLSNEANIALSVAAFAYTPCDIYSDRDGWRGQMYGGQIEFGQQAKLLFIPTAPPGVDFSGGLDPDLVQTGAHLGEHTMWREVAVP